MKSNRMFLLASALLVVMGFGAIWAFKGSWFSGDSRVSQVEQKEAEREAKERAAELASIPDSKAALAKSLGISEDDLVMVGGVWRPKRDVENSSFSNSEPGTRAPTLNPGKVPTLRGDENIQVAGMLAEIKGEGVENKKQVISSWTGPDQFNRDAFLKDPDAYLNKIKPGRVFAPAQPVDGVTPLEPVTPGFHDILQGEKVVIRVRADAGMPVTFYSPKVGSFAENRLSSITVQADDQGVARATFNAESGSLGIADIMAASPVHSGQLQFRVRINLPDVTNPNG